MKKFPKLTLKETSFFVLSVLSLALYSGCYDNIKPVAANAKISNNTPDNTVASPKVEVTEAPATKVVVTATPNAATILSRPEVPILCYHQLRDFKPSDSKTAKDYIVPVANFAEQMKWLADNGYHAILPDQLYDYLVSGAALPSKPVMITFDDTREDQYTVALPELNKYQYKGVFFIMTVSLNRPGYMSPEQVKQLSDEGHIIGSHTWNHSNVKKYIGADWITQVEKPSKQLQQITGKQIEYFAYPFGIWNKEAIVELKQRGFKSVFQLSAKRDENDPLFTIRRMIVPGSWSVANMQKWMTNSF